MRPSRRSCFVPAPTALRALWAVLALSLLPPGAAAGERPRVGLVLGGGGARGAAHVGVLEVLERLRVPVDCVAGTSMGALVAGAWAAGLTPAQMRDALARADWADMFDDNPGYEDLNFRSKRLAQRFLPGSETGIQNGGAVPPPGVVAGQKIKLFFNKLVNANTGEPQIETLPLPLSIIATDIGSGERVVFRDGSLTQAMRASMSVPGLMAPLDYRARKLVDGGLVDNVPIREVRDRCGAQVVIAVNVGSPLLRPEDVNGFLSISVQMIALLTEQNVSASLATLGPADIYIKPELGPVGSGDFDRSAEAAESGRRAAEAAAGPLAALALDETQYAAWRQSVLVRPHEVPRVDEIQIAGMLRVDPAVVQRYLEQRIGEPLDLAALDRDLLRAYGDGHYERVDYSVYTTRRGRNVLTVAPVEKSWGPDYLRLALRLDSNLSQGSTYVLRAGYQKTWLNDLGGELLVVGELGNSSGGSVGFYQPLDRAQRWFVDTTAEYRRDRNDYWFQNHRIAEYRSARSRIELVGGINFFLLGQLRAGWRETQVSNSLETGVEIFNAPPNATTPELARAASERPSGGWLLALDIEQADRLYFPRRGWSLQASFFDSTRLDYSRLAVDLRAAWPVQGLVLGTRAAWVGSTRGQLPLTDAARLGGLLNMTGFATGQLLGDDVAFAQLRAERIIGRAPLGLRGDLRLGVALETGRVGVPYGVQSHNGWLQSVAVYLGGESPVGPMFLGVGRGTGGSVNAYLVIGTP